MRAADWAALVFLGAVWGSSFFFGKLALRDIGPLTIVVLRVVIAAVLLNVAVRASGLRMPADRGSWRMFFTMGLLNSLIPFTLIFWGQQHIPSGLAAVLNATTPLFGVFLAHYLTREERLTVNRLVGVLLGLCGVIVMMGLSALSHGFDASALAQLAVLCAAALYAVSAIYGRRLRHLPSLVAASGQVTATAVMAVPLAFLVDGLWRGVQIGTVTWLAVTSLGVLSTALAYILYYRLLARIGASNLVLVTYLIPVSAIIFGTAFLGERLQLNHFAGMGLIAVGLACVDGRIFGRGRATMSDKLNLSHKNTQQ
jgi:drug/metabolite transporter (DMT)-like permease